jgi:hypothetical protein
VERLAYYLDAGEQKWRTNEHVFINVCSLCTREHFGAITNFVRFVRSFGGLGAALDALCEQEADDDHASRD